MNKLLLFFLVLISSVSLKAQKEMTEDEWQKQMDSLTLVKIKLIEAKAGLYKISDSIKIENKKLDSLLNEKKEEMYKILGVSFYQVSEYKKKFWDLYNRIENRIGDYESLCEELEDISKSRIRLLYEFRKTFEKMKEYMANFYK